MRPEIRFVLLANHVECAGGLLHMVGAGLTELWIPPAGPGGRPTCHFGVAVQAAIPWSETNKAHDLSLSVESEDGEVVFEIKRAVGARPSDRAPCPVPIKYQIRRSSSICQHHPLADTGY